MISRTWSEAEELYRISDDVNGKGKAKGDTREDAFLQLLESGEPIHGVKSLMKRALLMKGSRDMSAQLFTSCLRALDIPARLVFSLQPVTWRGAGAGGKSANPSAVTEQDTAPGGSTSPKIAESRAVASKGKAVSVAAQSSKLKSKRGEWAAKAEKAAKAIKAKSKNAENRTQHLREIERREDEGGSSLKPLPEAVMTSPPTNSPVIKLRKSRPPAKTKNWAKSPSPEPREMNRPPVFWTEVYSKPMKEWYCVDVTRKKMRCKNIMEPSRNNPENKMVYVIAYEEDNYLRDVTARYAHSFGATTMKARLPSKKNEGDWFQDAAALLQRPYKLGRDVKEDSEMEKAQVTEAMPTTVTGFKNHPKYVLERHLRREEVIYPKKPIGTFRGDSVYPRSSVVVCKSTETYMREGKRVKGGENPLKMVKPRTVTINRKRETELLKMDGQPVPLQGLFAEWQTELLIPPPIVDGVIPRNAYGNFDLFAPHMLPQGARHLPYKGIAKTARKLKVSYADAVVSFEFHRSRAAPVIDGIIVPESEAEFVLDAYWTSEEALEVKELERLEERCLKRWKKLIIGLRIRQRLQREYGPSFTQVSGSQGSQKPVQASINTESVRPVTSTIQQPIKAAGSELSNPTVPFELYTDHQMNPMVVPQPVNNGVDLAMRDLRQPEQENLEESMATDVHLPSSPKATGSDTLQCSPKLVNERAQSSSIDTPPRTRKSNRTPRNTRSTKAATRKGTNRKRSPTANDDGVSPLLKTTTTRGTGTVGSQKRQPLRRSSGRSPGSDPDLSSPLTSPPPEGEYPDDDAIISPPKRARLDQQTPNLTSEIIPPENLIENLASGSKQGQPRTARPARLAAIKANHNLLLTSSDSLKSKRTLRPRQ